MENAIEAKEHDECGTIPETTVSDSQRSKSAIVEHKEMENELSFSIILGATICEDTVSDESYFRVSFPQQDVFQTPVVTTWDRIHPDQIDPFEDKEISESAAIGDNDSDDDKNRVADEKAEKMPFSWHLKFSVNINETWATRFNEDPFIVVTHATKNLLWSTAYALDLSPFLDGDLHVIRTNESKPFTQTCLNSLTISVHASTVVLPLGLMELLNPLTFNVCNVSPLPGLRIDETNAKLRPYVIDPLTKQLDRFKLQKKYCKPVHSRFTLNFGKIRRSVESSLYSHGVQKLKLDYKTTVLVGDQNREQLAEILESQPVIVYLHDRDVSLCTTEEAVTQLTHELNAKYTSINEETVEEIVNDECKGEETKVTVKDLDREAWIRLHDLEIQDAQQQSRGQSTVSLSELLNSSKELIDRHASDIHGQQPLSFSPDRKATNVTARVPVLPMKRSIPIGGDVEKAEMDINEEERMMREPGRYLDADTEMMVKASLMYPVYTHRLAVRSSAERRMPKFERAVFMFQYQDKFLLQKLKNVLDSLNSAALPQVRSLRSYQLTIEEAVMAEQGSLDILTGVHIVDNDFRIIIVEGLSDGAMNVLLREQFTRDRANGDAFKILSNTQVRYATRLYTSFHVELKMIRLRDPLTVILQGPNIYDITRVDPACYRALACLCEIRSASRSKVLMRNGIFPEASVLCKLESKYGESVSLVDIEGEQRTSTKQNRDNRRQNETQQVEADELSKHVEHHSRRKALTDSHNKLYDKTKMSRVEIDYLKEHRHRRREVKLETKDRMLERADSDAELLRMYGDNITQLPMYSGQKLNFKEWQMGQLRKKLAGSISATYTYSKDFQSLAFPLVDEGLVEQYQQSASKAKFITQDGFKYPAIRTSAECRQGNRTVSMARVEELHQPWEQTTKQASKVRDFDCIPTKDYEIFGGYNKDGSKNPQFFTSVHQFGVQAMKEMKSDKVREEKEWKSKVVVDTLSMIPHQGATKQCQVDKYNDILQSKAAKKGLRIVRNAKLPSGKYVPLRRAPVSIFTSP